MEFIEYFESVATALGNAGFFLLLAVFCSLGIWNCVARFWQGSEQPIRSAYSESEAPDNPQADKE